MTLSVRARTELDARLYSDTYDRSVGWRAQIVRWHAAGYSAAQIASLANTTTSTVHKWINRYAQSGVAGLASRKAPSRARSRSVGENVRARILALSREPPPDNAGSARWSSRAMATYLSEYEGISVSHNFVATLWRKHRIQPGQHRVVGQHSGAGCRFQRPDSTGPLERKASACHLSVETGRA